MGIQSLPNKTSGPRGFAGEFYQMFKGLYSSQNITKNKRKGHIHSTSLVLPLYQNQTDATNKRKHNKTKHYRPLCLMNINAKIANNMLANHDQLPMKRIFHQDQVGFIRRMEGWSVFEKSVTMLHSINKTYN